MKTSNKLLIAALLFLLVALIAYDYQLKDAYDSGSYKNPYRDFKTLKFEDFDAVDVISSTAANVKFVQGPFKVMVAANYLEFLKVKQYGKRLELSVSFEHDYWYSPDPYVLIISCPKLVNLNVSASYMANGKEVIDTAVKEEWNMRKVLVDGFQEDSIFIKQDYASIVVLSDSRIKSVRVVTGERPGSGSKLIVLKNNHFDNTNIDVLNKSNFYLNDANIQNLRYYLADSARMIINGAAQNLLNVISKSNTK